MVSHREHIAVEVNGTPLIFGLRKHFAYGFQHTKALVTNNEFHTTQATVMEPLKETDPADLVLSHALSGTPNLTVPRLCQTSGQRALLDQVRHPLPPPVQKGSFSCSGLGIVPLVKPKCKLFLTLRRISF